MLTRSLRDTAACLDALAGPVFSDAIQLPAPDGSWLSELDADPGRLRVAYTYQPWSGAEVVAEIREACEATARLLAEQGHEVSEARPEFSRDQFLDTMTVIWSATTAQTIDGFAQAVGREPGPDNLEMPTYRMLEFGRAVTSQQLLPAIDTAAYLGRVARAFFMDFDVLLTPTLGALPAELGVYRTDAEIEPRSLFGSWAHLESFLPIFNASGQPAISLPLHMGAEGLPIGMQLVGRLGEEATLLRVASQLEDALPWAARRLRCTSRVPDPDDPRPVVVDRRTTPRGELVLRRAGGHHEVIMNGTFLMDTRDGRSERALVREALVALDGARVLLGGLGVGFSLDEALRTPGVREVVVVELEPAVVEWAGTHLRGLNEHGSGSIARVRVVVGDLLDELPRLGGGFDAVCLDVDNGPGWLVHEHNAGLYGDDGLDALAGLLSQRGRLSVWAAASDAAFERRLLERFAEVRTVEFDVPRGPADVVYVAAGVSRSRRRVKAGSGLRGRSSRGSPRL